MEKHKKQLDDVTDFIDLCLIIWKYKLIFLLFMFLGLILGLTFTYQQETIYETKFSVSVGHPAYSSSLLNSSSGVQELISNAELNPRKMPRIIATSKSTNSTSFFIIRSLEADIHEEITNLFKEIISQGLALQKSLALLDMANKKEFGAIQIKEINRNKSLPSSVISKISTDEILKQFKVTFGPSITIQPNPKKYALLGIFAGLLLAGLFVGLSRFTELYKKKFF